jgi:hypothetical protein
MKYSDAQRRDRLLGAPGVEMLTVLMGDHTAEAISA